MEGWKGTGWGIGCRSNKHEHERRRVMTRAARASVGDGAAASFYCRLLCPSPASLGGRPKALKRRENKSRGFDDHLFLASLPFLSISRP